MATVCIDVVGAADIEVTVEVIASPVDAESEKYTCCTVSIFMF